ncbi:hypothetical protein GGS23DRAFT_594460 [Durotheca rogersii]|uniref:uncharacterized protein n=1 Tax=Durotheca rogersii TaxID=419775 RepID=UPI0022209997|nr:uncharacterized protein GGS23DRAFT_594460 [Durotheca rogersii]KAI5866332.1 hypothetical protein GGS23DRAFT_594460 [Durotheca rogersii]
MAVICCDALVPYQPKPTDQESRFTLFMDWARFPRESSIAADSDAFFISSRPDFVVQVARGAQHAGPPQSDRFFARAEGKGKPFVEVTEKDLAEANYQKINAFKKFQCSDHDEFFTVNLYLDNPLSLRHWNFNLTFPLTSINL